MQFYESLLAWEKPYRIKQLTQAIYKDLVSWWDEITTLPESLRKNLDKTPFMPINVKRKLVSPIDKTKKILFQTLDWHYWEAVLMRHLNQRNTVCVSSQIWCKMACKFCSTWKIWFIKDLSADEILAQILFFARELKEENEQISNIVFMGMWEPMLNLESVLKSIDYLHDQHYFGLSARHITISTSWIVPGIKTLASYPKQINLAISIHAWTDEVRNKLMPVNSIYPLKDLINAVNYYLNSQNRKVFYEYIMINWINDQESEAYALWELIKSQVSHVNLIAYNPWNKSDYSASSGNKMHKFQEILLEYGIPSTIRTPLWLDIQWACGQLAWN